MNSIPMIEQVAGKGAARAAARKRGVRRSDYRRPGWLTYTLFALVLLISIYPLYFAFTLAASDAPTTAQNPIPSLIPAGNLFINVRRKLAADIDFWKALRTFIVLSVMTAL